MVMNEGDRKISDWGIILNKGYENSQRLSWITEAEGATVKDYSGKSYIDTVLGCGTAILGHSPSVVIEAVSEQVKKGTNYGLPSIQAERYAVDLKKAMPWNDHFVFCNSGSEATMRAIRIARAFTGKSRIGIFSGGWHGSHDMVLMEETPGSEEANPRAQLLSSGTPGYLKEDVVYLPYNHSNAFSLIKKHAADLAMVLIEPVQGSNPRDDIGAFLMELRKVTRDTGVLLGFDEVITGARLGLGGGQEYFDVYGDLTMYGKVFGGGMPVGVIGGGADIMRTLLGRGVEGDLPPLFMGGTFSGNPLTMAAGWAAFSYLQEQGEAVYGKLRRQGSYLRTSINQFCRERGIKAHMMGVESISRIIFSDKAVNSRHQRSKLEWNYGEQSAFFDYVKERGVLVGSNRILFLALPHTDDQINTVIKVLSNALETFQGRGVL